VKLNIDTNGMSFLVAVAPEPARDWETKEPRVDADGQQLYTVQLVALGEGTAQILPVKVAGDVTALLQGTPVKVIKLVATPWSMNDRTGVAFKAERIEPLVAAHAANGEAKAGKA
jgi:uncharacterized Zn ribbon protein